jgi:hypothetical protein
MVAIEVSEDLTAVTSIGLLQSALEVSMTGLGSTGSSSQEKSVIEKNTTSMRNNFIELIKKLLNYR